LHGSWNRTEKVGYKVIRVDIDARGNVIEALMTLLQDGLMMEK